MAFLRADGLPDEPWNTPDETDQPQSHKPDDSPTDEDDIPPHQKGLWA
jgi:hypothetical protein